jgi:hypothetical protein
MDSYAELEIIFKACPEKSPMKMKFDRTFSNLVGHFFYFILTPGICWVVNQVSINNTLIAKHH